MSLVHLDTGDQPVEQTAERDIAHGAAPAKTQHATHRVMHQTLAAQCLNAPTPQCPQFIPNSPIAPMRQYFDAKCPNVACPIDPMNQCPDRVGLA